MENGEEEEEGGRGREGDEMHKQIRALSEADLQIVCVLRRRAEPPCAESFRRLGYGDKTGAPLSVVIRLQGNIWLPISQHTGETRSGKRCKGPPRAMLAVVHVLLLRC